jgi:alkylation response protein AidB-like acyl-CoA dehydrogenase
MPVIYTIDPVRQRITCTGHGILTKDELDRHIKQLQTDPAFDRRYRQFWDLSDVTRVDLNFHEMMWLAEMNIFAPTTPRAFLASTDATFGVARMFEMLREAKGETGIRVFRDRAGALAWLDQAPVTESLPAVVPAI